MTHVAHIPATNAPTIARRVDAAGWGFFFIWVGVALIAHLGWGVGLLGVGGITVGVQLMRKHFGLTAEPFWVVLGLLFAIGGVAEFAAFQFNLLPVVLIIGGAALLFSAFRNRGG
jgi:hypothetical protein